MSRRIDVELTSARDDGTWTWRAAGAKQPKGVVDVGLLYAGAKVGDLVRAEADFEMDGITITAMFPPKGAPPPDPQRLEIIGTPREFEPVTSSLVPKSERSSGGRDRDRRPRPDGPDRDRPSRPRRDGEAERKARPAGDRSPAGRGGDPRSTAGSARPSRPPRPERPERPERPAPPPKPKRLTAGNVHRSAVLESLPPEHRPIAEHVLRGGIPAVRQAVEQQNAKIRADGGTTVSADPLIAIAEDLLPRLKAADWRDRAEAAAKDVDEIAIRDLRSVVAGADAVARDDEARLLASTLREALDRRVAKLRQDWVEEVTACLGDGRLVRALRVAARPPDPTTRLAADLALKLSEAAGAALSPDIASDRWAVVLEAVAESPVRRSVKPVGLPAEPSEALLQAAKQASGQVPALAKLLGIDMPPPPGPRRPVKPALRRPPPPPSTPPRASTAPAPAEASAVVDAAEASAVVDAAEASAVVDAAEASAVVDAVDSAPVEVVLGAPSEE